jgi:hypothetical protein
MPSLSFCRRRCAFVAFGLAATAFALGTPLKIDFSIANRSDSFAPGYEQWIVPGTGSSDTKSFQGVTMTLSAVEPRTGHLTTTWWKGGAIAGAKMSVDGISIAGGDAGAQLELRLSGLTPGRHTLATFHNVSGNTEGPRLGRFDVLVNGVAQLSGLVPSQRVESDYDATSAFLTFEAEAGRDVVILFRADARDTAAGSKNLVLCGLELDGANPQLRASRPSPANGDEHANADSGSLDVAWSAPTSAVSHLVYFGRSREAVSAATTASREFLGKANDRRRVFASLTPQEDYFWRVDTVNAAGVVTKGETWSFRSRRLAFPGAEGYGRFARGGRGGRVIEVTNLEDRGPGSLRAAIEADGPRTIVFAVSGLITLESKLVIKNPYVTVAGQTAPGKGITLRKYNFGILGSHDAIIRFVRVRPGDISGTTLDGMGMAATDHSIIDHTSISWTIDESFSSRGAQNITLQHVLISEALNEAGHKKYPVGSHHGYAASISGLVGSFHHNLLAHNSGRNWSLAGGLDQAGRHTGWLDLRNNVVYNWDNRTTDGGAAKVNYVNNYYKPGPASHVFHLLKPERNNIQGFGPQDYFIAGNVMEGHVPATDALGGVIEPNPARANRASGDAVVEHDDAKPTRFEPLASFVKDRPFFEPYVETQTARLAYKRVLSDVGCSLPLLDEHDERVIRETRDTTFTFRGSKTKFPGLPDSQNDVGGWENYPEEHRAADWDTDHDGLPDWWETLHQLNPHSAGGDFSDSNAVANAEGFTQLEAYLNWLARPHLECAPTRSVEMDLSRLTRGFTAKPVHAITGVAHGQGALLADGHTLRFTPAEAFVGIASVDFSVKDAEGDSWTQTIDVAVR